MRQIVNSLWYSGDVIGAQSGAHWLEIGVRECLLQPLTLSYLRTKIQLTKVGHVTYQNVENFLSFLEYPIRICLQKDPDVVFY